MKNITKISFCKTCGKLLYIRNLCSICSINFQNMKPKQLKKQVERMNKQRLEGFDFLNKCELCGLDSEMPEKWVENQVCVVCKEKEE